MGFLIALGVNAGIYLLGYLYRRYFADVPDSPDPRLDVPRNTQGSPIPVVFGRVLLESPFVLWHGAPSFSSYSSSASKKWSLPLHYALCRTSHIVDSGFEPVVKMLGVWVDKKKLPTRKTDPVTPGDPEDIYLVNRGFGPEFRDADDTLSGWMVVPRSGQDAALAPSVAYNYERWGFDSSLVPPNQGTLTVMLVDSPRGATGDRKGFRFTESSSIPPVGFEVMVLVGMPGLDRRYWEVRDGDANPACVLYNLIANDEDGRLGYADSDIDLTSFQTAAVTLWREGNGYSRMFYQDSEISNTFTEICKQIEGSVDEDPVSGKFTLRLARADYDPETVPVLDTTNIIQVANHETVGWSSLATAVRLKFRRRRGRIQIPLSDDVFYPLVYVDGFAEWRNQPTSADLNVTSVDVDMPGVSNEELAASILARHVRTLTVPMTRASLLVDRSLFFAYPNQVFKVEHPDLGNLTYFMRVASVDIGEPESNAIALTLYRDRFYAPYRTPAPPSPIHPLTPYPEPIVDGFVEEAPYFFQYLSSQLGGVPDQAAQRLWYHASNPGGNTGFRGYLYDTGVMFDTDAIQHSGTVVLAEDYARENEPVDTTVGFDADVYGWTPVDATDEDILRYGRNILLINGELIGFHTATSLGGTLYQFEDLLRGLGGTVPRDHAEDDVGFVVLSPVMDGATAFANLGQHGLLLDTETGAGVVGVSGSRTSYVRGTPEDLIIRKRVILPGTPSNLLTRLPDWLLTSDVDFTNLGQDILTEGVSFFARTRRRDVNELTRGDAVDEDPPEATVYDTVVIADGVTFVVNSGALSPSESTLSLSAGTYGDVQIGVRSRYDDFTSWQVPTVPARLFEFRNLLRNGRFIDDLDYWEVSEGDPLFGSGFTQTSQVAFAADPDLSASQTVSLANWRAGGMSAVLDFLVIRAGDSDDTVTVNLTTRDGSSDLTTVTYGPTIPVATTTRESLRIDNAEYETVGVRVGWTETAVADGDSPITNSLAGDYTLRVGQISEDLGTNMSFESGLTDWSTDVGGYTDETTLAKVGTHRLQGQANPVNTLYRDFSVDEYRWGYFVVDASCMHPDASPNSSATLTLEARSSGGTVLETESVSFTPTTQNLWVPLVGFVRIPTGATVVRVRLIGTRLSASNNRLSWDDVVARHHKYLRPQMSNRLQFAPTAQDLPYGQADWARCAPACPVPGVSLRPQASDGEVEIYGTDRKGLIHGVFSSEGDVSVPAWEFHRVDEGGMRCRDSAVGKFRVGASFTLRLVFNWIRDAESVCLLQRVVDGIGWDLVLDGGCATVNLYGESSTKTAALGNLMTTGVNVLIIRYDHVFETLALYGVNESASVSTAGMGEILTTTEFDGGFLYVARTSSGDDTPTISVAALDIWGAPLSDPQRMASWTHGRDVALPGVTGGVVAQESAVATAVGQDSSGVLVGYSMGGQIPRHGLGMAVARDRTNLAGAFDQLTVGASSNYDSATVATTQTLSVDGRHATQRVTGDDNELAVLAVPVLSAATRVNVTFFARSGTPGTLPVVLLNTDDGGTLVDSATFTVTDVWQRVDVAFDGWDNSTSGALIGFFGSSTGTDGSVEICGPFFVDQEALGPPVVIPVIGSSLARVTVEDPGVTAQFNHEGEILVRFGTLSDDQNDGTLVAVGVESSNKNLRSVGFSADDVVFRNHDATNPYPAVTSEISPDLSDATVRCRWNRAGLLDVPSTFSGVVGPTGSDYDGTSTFSADNVESGFLWLGHSNETDETDAVLYEVWLRSREPLLE